LIFIKAIVRGRLREGFSKVVSFLLNYFLIFPMLTEREPRFCATGLLPLQVYTFAHIRLVTKLQLPHVFQSSMALTAENNLQQKL
jgi:hypothetical protein